MNLATIIKMLKRGDQDAFRQLVYDYTGKLMVVAKIYTQNIEDAQDALQDGFIMIYKNINKLNYSEEAPFLGWMRKIVMNEALKKYRKKSFKMESYNLEFVEEQSVEPVSFANIEKEELLKEIHKLPFRFKQVVCLFALEGYTHKEIAEMLGIEPSSSRAAFSRAKSMLRKNMTPTHTKDRNRTESNPEMVIVSNKKKCI